MAVLGNRPTLLWKLFISILRCFLFLSLLYPASLQAQKINTIQVRANQVLVLRDTIYLPQQDTIILLADTIKYKIKANPYYRSDTFYDSLHAKAYRKNVTRELYKLLIRPPARDVYESDEVVKSEQYFIPYAGKTIRSVRVLHVPLLDGVVWDTTQLIPTRFGTMLEHTHTNTRSSLIKKNILFQEGDQVDAYLLADSERILRALPFIEDSRIYLLNHPEKEDEVNVTVVIKDRLPWTISGSISNASRYKVRLGNRNILGTGNQLWGEYVHNSNETPKNGYEFRFESQNIANSFTRVILEWADTWQVNKRIVRVVKDFVSPEIKYGGEISVGDEAQRVEQVFLDSTMEYEIHKRFQDVWVGRAFTLPSSDHRKTLMVGVRYLHNDFLERPEVSIDTNERFHNRHFWLSSLSLQKINYLKTRYILAYGITEDVPVGYAYGLLYGKDFAEFETRDYWGGEFLMANYLPSFGYLLLSGEAGTFWDGEAFKNSIIKFRIGYFSPLVRMGKTNIRNFVQLDYAVGQNLSLPEALNIKDYIEGLSGNFAYGNSIITGQIESVWFTPWYFYGFRLAPFLNMDVGQVVEDRGEFRIDSFIAGIGGGLRVRNESLVFRTLEVEVKYFPVSLPESSKWAIDFSLSLPVLFGELTPFKPNVITLD